MGSFLRRFLSAEDEKQKACRGIGTHIGRCECYLALILVITRTAFIVISLERYGKGEREGEGGRGSQRGEGEGVRNDSNPPSFIIDSARAYLSVTVVAIFTIPITATAVILAPILHFKADRIMSGESLQKMHMHCNRCEGKCVLPLPSRTHPLTILILAATTIVMACQEGCSRKRKEK